MIKILVADDYGIVRSGIRSLLQNVPDIKIVAEANSGEEAVKLAQRMKPDVVLMDINMPDTDGFTASMQLLNSTFPIKVLIISAQEDHLIPQRLLKMGVSGYLTKNDSPEKLIKAIYAVHSGKCFFKLPDPNPAVVHLSTSPFSQLSDRELQVALMVGRGMKAKEIGDRLFLSKKTINDYHRDLLKKLGVSNDVGLLHLIIKYGLIDLDSVLFQLRE